MNDPKELMPDDVAAAIERCKAHVIGRKVTGMQKELTAAIEILIRAASTRASHPLLRLVTQSFKQVE